MGNEQTKEKQQKTAASVHKNNYVFSNWDTFLITGYLINYGLLN